MHRGDEAQQVRGHGLPLPGDRGPGGLQVDDDRLAAHGDWADGLQQGLVVQGACQVLRPRGPGGLCAQGLRVVGDEDLVATDKVALNKLNSEDMVNDEPVPLQVITQFQAVAHTFTVPLRAMPANMLRGLADPSRRQVRGTMLIFVVMNVVNVVRVLYFVLVICSFIDPCTHNNEAPAPIHRILDVVSRPNVDGEIISETRAIVTLPH